jgi:hypothetical protein
MWVCLLVHFFAGREVRRQLIVSRAMKLAQVVCRAVLIATLFASIAGCNSDSPPRADPDGPPSPTMCEAGAKECRADGLYTCDESGAFQRTEACTACQATPVPHCAVSCGDEGVTSICDGASVKDCATGAMRSCETGTCLPSGKQGVCATKPGVSTCQGRRTDGTQYVLACADANGIADDKVCDRRTGTCVGAQFDCSTLTTVPANKYACDASSGHYYSTCTAGQPTALTCNADTKCRNDMTTSCYTPAVAGSTCGGPTVCYPGLHCTQLAAAGATCVQPAGILACSSTDVLAVCNDVDTAVACVKGAVWWWKNLTTWGGSCTANHVNLAAGGTCIPGLADCKPGLECQRSRYDIAGTCRIPEPNAPAECTLTGQLSTGRSCIYDWHACRDGHYYDVDCRIVNVGGNVLTVCDCSLDGVKGNTFAGSEVCNVTTTAMLDTKVRTSCGWQLTTVEVAQ